MAWKVVQRPSKLQKLIFRESLNIDFFVKFWLKSEKIYACRFQEWI
jgi:hypothetical protein